MRRGACVRVRASAGTCSISVCTANLCGSSTVCLTLCLTGQACCVKVLWCPESAATGFEQGVWWAWLLCLARFCQRTSAGGCLPPFAEECARRCAKSGVLDSNHCRERKQALLMLREGSFGISERQSQRQTVRTSFRTSLLCLLRLLLHRQGAAPWQRVLCLCSARTGDTMPIRV